MITNECEQLEGIKENLLKRETGTVGRSRCIKLATITTALTVKTEKLCMPEQDRWKGCLMCCHRNLQKWLDKRLKEIPVLPQIDEYGAIQCRHEQHSGPEKSRKRKKLNKL